MRKWKKGLEPLTELVVEVVEVVVGDWVSLRGTGVFSTMVAASERTSKADSGATKPTLIPASKTGFCQSEALEKRIGEIQGSTVADWSKALHWEKMKNKKIPGSPPRATLFEEPALSWSGQFFAIKQDSSERRVKHIGLIDFSYSAAQGSSPGILNYSF